MITKLFLLLCGHALGDFVFQSDSMAIRKNPNRRLEDIQNPMSMPPAWMWLLAHSLIHGGIVYLITNNIYLGLIETFFHYIIDLGKCKRLYNLYVDQFLHILCKAVYLFYV